MLTLQRINFWRRLMILCAWACNKLIVRRHYTVHHISRVLLLTMLHYSVDPISFPSRGFVTNRLRPIAMLGPRSFYRSSSYTPIVYYAEIAKGRNPQNERKIIISTFIQEAQLPQRNSASSAPGRQGVSYRHSHIIACCICEVFEDVAT